MSGLSNGQQAILMLLVFILPVWITWTANSSPMDRTSLLLVVSASLSGVLAFIKELLGGKPSDTTTTTTTSTPTRAAKTYILTGLASKFKFFFASFAHDTTAMAGRKRRHSKSYYDPQPRRHRRHGPRKGVEPSGLRRWRLSHRRTHDPGYQHSLWRGPRGGHYFRGPRKNRYDPQPRRRRFSGYWGRHPRQKRVGKGIEGMINHWGTALGFALGLGAGVYQGYQTNDAYMKANGFTTGKPDPTGAENTWQRYWNMLVGWKNERAGTRGSPEIFHLWATKDPAGYNTVNWLKYKFLGTDPMNKPVGSAWVMPFWVSFGAWIGSLIGLKIGKLGKLHRILRPINKIAKGATIGTLIGALALPGCGPHGPSGSLPPPPPNTINMNQVSPGQYAPASVPTIEFTYKG